MLGFSRSGRRRAFLVVATAALAAGLTACGSGADENVGPTGTSTASYVALGDSYTSAPWTGATVGTDGCYRSDNNYPRLVAHAMHLTLADRSCTGAPTTAIAHSQRTLTGTMQPPQIDAVGAKTKVVTLGIGANDFTLFNLIASVCPGMAADDPHGAPCTDANDALPTSTSLTGRLSTIGDRVSSILHEIGERGPHARVLVVGYPSIVPAHGSCTALASTAGDVPFLDEFVTGLNEQLSTAAQKAGATYVDLYAATTGHDICSTDPWIAGKKQVDGKVAAWHPYEAEQKAAARLVTAALRKS